MANILCKTLKQCKERAFREGAGWENLVFLGDRIGAPFHQGQLAQLSGPLLRLMFDDELSSVFQGILEQMSLVASGGCLQRPLNTYRTLILHGPSHLIT